ncbi:unnamed protein product [Phytophthora lilii]|uniref:Unnamed protein product n=1 Tax=Phytophthora lilii TaxID=2077276 RepID=A0A9W6TE40_9STRA|nr:unnamed protein product [Phytophthora lilii]
MESSTSCDTDVTSEVQSGNPAKNAQVLYNLPPSKSLTRGRRDDCRHGRGAGGGAAVRHDAAARAAARADPLHLLLGGLHAAGARDGVGGGAGHGHTAGAHHHDGLVLSAHDGPNHVHGHLAGLVWLPEQVQTLPTASQLRRPPAAHGRATHTRVLLPAARAALDDDPHLAPSRPGAIFVKLVQASSLMPAKTIHYSSGSYDMSVFQPADVRNLRLWASSSFRNLPPPTKMDTMLGWGTLSRASHDAVPTDSHVDAALAVALLFGTVVLPPLVGIRTMYTNCWFAFTIVAHLLASEAALGIATSMGITIMVGWYSLRVFDRYAFTAILNGWLGVWATSPLLGVAARVGDVVLHLLVPMLLVSCYLPLVRVWMSDFIVRDDSFWLDWMSEGLVAIGESYVGCLWATNSARTLDEVVASLLTIPMEGRQEMYRSWSARFVALAARLFNYPPSSMGLVVGAVSEQFDLCPEFRQAYMDRYFHQGFGIWTAGTTSIDDAQINKLSNLDQLLDIRSGHTILDISIGSWGGVGSYLAKQHADATVVCILSSVQELARAKKFARELEVFDQMEFVLAESPEKLLTILSGFRAAKFDRINLCGVVETMPDIQRTRFLRTVKRIQTTTGTTLLEFSACTAAHMMTHAWSNKYVHSAYPCYAITLPLMRRLAGDTGFTLRDTVGYSDHYERTFIEWNHRFQVRWGHEASSTQTTTADQPAQLQHMPSLPESFKRTWEFYLLHSAACYRSDPVAGGGAWKKHVDEKSGSAYYYNASTGESSWEEPAGFKEPAARAPKWREFVDDESGATYYYDEASGTSRWDKPEDFVSEEQEPQSEEQAEADYAPERETEVEKKAVRKEEKAQEDDEAEAEVETKDTATAAQQWVKYVDPASNKPYYHNASSGKTQWEEPEGFDKTAAAAVPAGQQVSAEYQAHLNQVHAERLARVTQHVLDPSGNLTKLNAILSGIDRSAPSTSSSATTAGSSAEKSAAGIPRTPKAEWHQHIDAQTQRYYYHNVVTGVTQWTKPDAPIVSGLADWIPPEVAESDTTRAGQRTVSGVNYIAQAKFNRLTGKYEQLGGDEYWQNAGIASDRAGRQMSHFFDLTELEKNREEARRRKEQLKRKHIDWKKISAEKKAKKRKQQNEWLYTD